jgi:hypothetical protein
MNFCSYAIHCQSMDVIIIATMDNNIRKIICILPEDGSTEPKYVAMKRTSSNKGYIKSVV